MAQTHTTSRGRCPGHRRGCRALVLPSSVKVFPAGGGASAQRRGDFSGLAAAMVLVVCSDESLIFRNLDWNLKAGDKWKWVGWGGGVAVSIPVDKWPVMTKRWFYIFRV